MKVYIVEKISRFDYEALPTIMGVYTSYELAEWYVDEELNVRWDEIARHTGFTYDGEWLIQIKEFPLIGEKNV